MTQAWYQAGVSVFDFTDSAHPKEIAYYDRGPISGTSLVLGGLWSTYYYNGAIYGSEIARFDVWALTPTADLSQNEIDAAAEVRLDRLTPQHQPRLVNPPSFAVVRSYRDQLVRRRRRTRRRSSSSTISSPREGSRPRRAAARAQLNALANQDELAGAQSRRCAGAARARRRLGNTRRGAVAAPLPVIPRSEL